MDFRSINKFNVIVNAISGNFFPLTENRRSFNLGKTMFAILMWLVDVLYVTSAVIGGINYVPLSTAFEEGCVLYIAVVELIIISVYLNARRGRLRTLIRKFNEILIDSADFKRCVHESVEPNKQYLKLYTLAAISSVLGWAASPIFKVFTNDRFTYNDYTVTAYIPGEPFTAEIFIYGGLLQVIGVCSLAFKKVSIDIYISYFVTLLTAEFRYVREQLAVALRRHNDSEKDDVSATIALQKCVQHHCAVIETGQILIELMAVHVGLTYINSIMRFCFIAHSFTSCSGEPFKQFMFCGYGSGILIQLFMLCSCAQEMLESSTSITDDAFHEDWHGYGVTVQNIFSTIELSNQMERRMSAYRVVDLARPTVVSILNKAYSVFLLLQRMK